MRRAWSKRLNMFQNSKKGLRSVKSVGGWRPRQRPFNMTQFLDDLGV